MPDVPSSGGTRVEVFSPDGSSRSVDLVESPCFIGRGDGSGNHERILTLTGPLNIQTIFDFQTAVRAEKSADLIVDFSGVTFIDSAGLGALVGVHVAAQRANRKLAFAAMNTQVRALVEMTHVDKFFRMFPTIHEAEAAIS
jgi:anti-sigma B factor antagonist